jgi:UDP-N-acetylmuramoyl-tripeptide--D-alanyl-D-alanine ligase
MTVALATDAAEIAVEPMRWNGEEIVAATGASSTLPAAALRARAFSAVSTDSRRVSEGSIFFALRGPNHDAHDYVAQALAAGAGAAVVERVPPGVDGAACFVVADALRALGDLAHWSRQHVDGLQVIAITGSNGKTTTKEMVAAVCEEATRDLPGAVLKTAGNQNNLVGLPLTLLRMTGEESLAILEMGMNQPGEIARLTEIARPDVGVITNIGAAHLEGLGSVDGVAAAKAELFGGMSEAATICVNLDDEKVVHVASRFRGRRVEFGRGGEIRASDVVDRGLGGLTMKLHVDDAAQTVELAFAGAHNVHNALAAAALGHALGFSLHTIAAGLEAARPPAMRMQVVELANGAKVINDAYNANPNSVIAGLRALAASSRAAGGRSWAVLGEMRELGGHSARLHREVGAEAARVGIDFLVAVGPQAEQTAAGARDEGGTIAVHECADAAGAAALVGADIRGGDVVLVKGSRGADDDPAVRRYGSRMAEVVALLEERARA